LKKLLIYFIIQLLNQMDETIPQSTPKNNSSKFLIPLAVVIIALGIIAFMARGGQRTQDADTDTSPETMTSDNSGDTSETTTDDPQSYKDGTYSATGNYVSPGGAEELDVKITLQNGIITDSEVDSKATRPNSVRFQGLFVSGYKPLIIGKNINDVKLDKVSGSSLAPGGFNDALNEIKQQARS
jgi:uncharacterized protein with FMN-binding domain